MPVMESTGRLTDASSVPGIKMSVCFISGVSVYSSAKDVWVELAFGQMTTKFLMCLQASPSI